MRIRVTRPFKVRRVLAMGRAVHSYPVGDYEVGPDSPEDVARDAIKRGDAKRLRGKGQRQTKVA